MLNKGIVRNRNKILSTIKGAQIWQDIESSIGFNNYVWDFVNGKPIVYAWMEACGIVNNHLVSCPCYEKIRNL